MMVSSFVWAASRLIPHPYASLKLCVWWDFLGLSVERSHGVCGRLVVCGVQQRVCVRLLCVGCGVREMTVRSIWPRLRSGCLPICFGRLWPLMAMCERSLKSTGEGVTGRLDWQLSAEAAAGLSCARLANALRGLSGRSVGRPRDR